MTTVKKKNKKMRRRYNSVEELMEGEGWSQEVKEMVRDESRSTNVTRNLATSRAEAGLTQEELGKLINKSQSAISKLESGRDEDLTLDEIMDYAAALKLKISLHVGPPINHVEAIKMYALEMRANMLDLARLSNKDQDEKIREGVQKFFGEAFFNIMEIFGACLQEMPALSNNIKVKVQFLGSPQKSEPDPDHELREEKTKKTEEIYA